MGSSGLSQKQLAQRMGVSQGQLSQWLSRTLVAQSAVRVGRKVTAYLAFCPSVTLAGERAPARGDRGAAATQMTGDGRVPAAARPSTADGGHDDDEGSKVSLTAGAASGSASPASAVDGSGSSLAWLQCYKCDKWRRVDEVTAAVFSVGESVARHSPPARRVLTTFLP